MCIQRHIFARATCFTKKQILHIILMQKCQSICNLSSHIKNMIWDFNSLSIYKSINNKSSPQKKIIEKKIIFFYIAVLKWTDDTRVKKESSCMKNPGCFHQIPLETKVLRHILFSLNMKEQFVYHHKIITGSGGSEITCNHKANMLQSNTKIFKVLSKPYENK